MSVGKRFENELRKSFMEQFPNAFVYRIPDSNQTWGGHKTPADMIVCTGDMDLLIECKAFKGPSLPMANVKLHQVEALEAFDAMHESCHGWLLCFPHRGKRKVKGTEAYIIPIDKWVEFFRRNSRKSYPLQEMEKCQSITWSKGRWDLSSIRNTHQHQKK